MCHNGQRRLYCCKRPEYIIDESDIAQLVDRLCVEKVHVEEWLPKARWQGRNFDLRVVAIAGQACHTVARVSTGVFTNLNLGNQRGDLAGILARLGPYWHQVKESVSQAARLFPRSFTLGFDVLIRPDFRRHAFLEVNAFGNLLPGLLHENQDTYTAAVAAWQRLENRGVPA